MTDHATYTINDTTLDNMALILSKRPGISKSYLVRELIAAEAKRIREELHKEQGVTAA